MTLTAPFPYFGGKRRVAPVVWRALGQPKHYIEPFFGSGAVLLARPGWRPSMVETVCDKDGFVANVWRAMKWRPDETAQWVDWPVNHADLTARRRALMAAEQNLLAQLIADPEWCDPKLAGWWIWAASCWIGSSLTNKNDGFDCMPSLTCKNGINITGKHPHIGAQNGGGKGVNATSQIPFISHFGCAITTSDGERIRQWFAALSARLRRVRVVCGDWTRICGGNWQAGMGDCGIFFDPPYGVEADRDPGIYHADNLTVAADVRAWCIERGSRPSHRIILAGYREEHEELLSRGWRMHQWIAQGGYSNRSNGAKRNRFREALFLSPHCYGVDMLDLARSATEEDN